MVGGNRGLRPLEHLGARVYPDMFSLARAHTAFDSDSRIENAALRERFEMTIAKFLDLVEASTHYPCAKRAGSSFSANGPILPWRPGTPGGPRSFRA